MHHNHSRLRDLVLAVAAVLLLPNAAQSHPAHGNAHAKPLPLIIWHGLGDKFNNEGLQSTGELVQQVHPGTYVYYVRLDDDGGNDQKATFFGNVTEQVAQVCETLKSDPHLQITPEHRNNHDDDDDNDNDNAAIVRFDAMGFSQGGQFLRGLIETCPGLSVRSLVTFGSQHNGIAEFQSCGPWDFLCKGANAIMSGNAWTPYVQGHLVPAQYYRTLNDTTGGASNEFLRASNFLADINNEREEKKSEYASRLASLEKLVMFVFENDTTVIPKESGWFAEVNRTSGHVTPLRERPIYKDDWIGLRELDEKGGLVFESTPGKHMSLNEKVLSRVYREYFGPESKDKSVVMYEEKETCGMASRLLWSTAEKQFNEWNRLWFWQRWLRRWRLYRFKRGHDVEESL